MNSTLTGRLKGGYARETVNNRSKQFMQIDGKTGTKMDGKVLDVIRSNKRQKNRDKKKEIVDISGTLDEESVR